MPSDRPWEPGPHDLVVPFVFVPHGAPEPTDWMAEHPGWVKFPATMIVRGPHAAGYGTTSLSVPALGTAIAATPEAGAVADGVGEALAQFLGATLAEVVAAAAAAGTVLLNPAQTAPREMDEVHPYSGRDPEHESTEGLSLALLAEAARAGWRTDDVTNVAPLPASRNAPTSARLKGDSTSSA